MKKGFSLVELLIVLVVIGIILAIVLPNTLRAIEQANVRDTAATLRAIDTAINLCYSQTRNWGECDTIAELTGAEPPYIDETIPTSSPFGIAYTIEAGPGGSFQSDKDAHFPSWPALDPHN